jgi:glycosyltransferase involved in cell wall biosynthesis
MKIAFIVLKGIPLGGGIEKYSEEVGSRLVKRGHEVVVYTMRHYGTKAGMFKGMEIRAIRALKYRSLEKMSSSFSATLKQMAGDADIIHYHAFGPAMFCFMPRIFGKKVVVRGCGIEWKRSRWNILGRIFLRLSEIPSVRFANKVVVVSKVLQDYIKDKYNINSMHIPTGVSHPNIEEPDLIKKYGLNGNDYILFAARLVQEKGAHYLINAYQQLNTKMKLVIAGDSHYEDSYKAELLKLKGGNENIIFTGFVTGKLLDELFSNAYLFVLPSEIEGLSLALRQAMSFGNCCLVSDIPENLEATNYNGFSFKKNDVNDLMIRLDELQNKPELVNSVKKKARDYVLSNFNWDVITDQLEDLYEKTLLEKSPVTNLLSRLNGKLL